MSRILLVVGFIACIAQDLRAREVLLIGQDGQISWAGRVTDAEGISTIRPEHRSFLDPNVTEIGNAPADLIEFNSADFPASILPRRVGEAQNLASEALERGGSLRAPTVFDLTSLQLQVIFEDMLVQEPTGQAFERKEDDILGTQIILDLGARFGVNRLRFFPRNTIFAAPGTPFHNDFLKDFEVEINDGLVLTNSGNPIWESYEVRNDNGEQITEVHIDPPRYIRFLRLRATSAIPFEIEKLQVFGEGFFPTARYISPVIDMGSPANWGLIRILQEQVGAPGKVDMQIRTRSGNDESPLAYTRRQVALQNAQEIPFSVDDPDEPLLQDEYLKLPERGRQGDDWERGSVREDLANWSPWTSPYLLAELAEGTQILSPGPSRYFQFRVDFLSDDLEASHILKQIAIEFSAPPLADQLVGEIFPREVVAAEDISFVYAVRAVMESVDLQSFNSFEISTPSRVGRIERIEIINASGESVLDHTFAVQDAITEEGGVAITAIEDRRFAVRFPPIDEHDTVVKIHFVSRILAFSTRFGARALLIEEDDFQGITPGNAALLEEGDLANQSGITVLSRSVTKGSLIGNFTLGSEVLTPNEDGINDVLGMNFEILAVIGKARILVDLYDLAGRRVRRLFDAEGQNGVYNAVRFPQLNWDGTNDQGERVAPGIYLVRVEVDGDARTGQTTRPIGVVY
jgi:hypothetical protein